MVVLVSALVVSASASGNNEKNDKNVKKRGLAAFHGAEFGNFQPSYGPHQQGQFINYATPLLTSLQAHGPVAAPFAAPLAEPLANHVAAPLPAPLAAGAPVHFQSPLGAPVHFQSALPAAPLTTQFNTVEKFVPNQFPVQFRTLFKNVHVPYERHIAVDNPIYTPFERHVPIDNPVPVFKYITQNVPIHVEQPVPVPIVKEVRVPEPYLHKVRLVLQRVFVEEQPQRTYLPPPPPQPAPVYGPPPQPSPVYGLPPQQPQPQVFSAPAPNSNYLPPHQHQHQHEHQHHH